MADTVVIGDSRADIRAARQAGAHIVLVNHYMTAPIPENDAPDVALQSFLPTPHAMRRILATLPGVPAAMTR